ncbi:MAG: hypothetical protein ACI3Z7_04985 [Candidatus Aphodosoma sp.]
MLLNKFFYITHTETTAGCLTVLARFNQEHEIFKAHFPGNPVTPGVCQIQMVSEIISAHIGREAILTDAKNIKYLLPIDPISTPEVAIQLTQTASGAESCKVTAVFTEDEKIFSKMTLTYHVVCNNPNI